VLLSLTAVGVTAALICCQHSTVCASQCGSLMWTMTGSLCAPLIRSHELECKLRASLAVAESDAAAARATCGSAEQRLAAADAALAASQASALALSARLNAAAEEAAAAADALRARLAAAETGLADSGKREQELKAEVSMLAGNISAMQQRHVQVRKRLLFGKPNGSCPPTASSHPRTHTNK
jgi:hypothetical protein